MHIQGWTVVQTGQCIFLFVNRLISNLGDIYTSVNQTSVQNFINLVVYIFIRGQIMCRFCAYVSNNVYVRNIIFFVLKVRKATLFALDCINVYNFQ